MKKRETEPDTRGTVVIGLGNSLMRDDGVGIRVAKELMKRSTGERVKVLVYQELDLSLIEGLRGARKVIVVDALRSGKPPGTVSKYSFAGGDAPQLELPSLHGLRLSDIFALARYSGLLTCPVTVIGVEPKDCRPGKRISPEVAASIPEVLKQIELESTPPAAENAE